MNLINYGKVGLSWSIILNNYLVIICLGQSVAMHNLNLRMECYITWVYVCSVKLLLSYETICWSLKYTG